jgi:cobalamin biosynthesis protein CobD/CbiB
MTAAAVLVAAALDVTVREPPLAVHPVRITGRYLAAAQRWLRPDPPGQAIVSGGVAWGIGAASAALGLAVERWARNRSRSSATAVVLGLALWPLGRVAARADDVLNLLPSRLTAALLADWTVPDAMAALRLARRRGWLAIGLAVIAAGARSRPARRL